MYSYMFSKPTLYIDKDIPVLDQATVIRSDLVRNYDKRGRTAGSYPRRDKNRKAGYITHNKNCHNRKV